MKREAGCPTNTTLITAQLKQADLEPGEKIAWGHFFVCTGKEKEGEYEHMHTATTWVAYKDSLDAKGDTLKIEFEPKGFVMRSYGERIKVGLFEASDLEHYMPGTTFSPSEISMKCDDTIEACLKEFEQMLNATLEQMTGGGLRMQSCGGFTKPLQKSRRLSDLKPSTQMP